MGHVGACVQEMILVEMIAQRAGLYSGMSTFALQISIYSFPSSSGVNSIGLLFSKRNSTRQLETK